MIRLDSNADCTRTDLTRQTIVMAQKQKNERAGRVRLARMTAALMASLLMTLAAGSNAIAQTPTITPIKPPWKDIPPCHIFSRLKGSSAIWPQP